MRETVLTYTFDLSLGVVLDCVLSVNVVRFLDFISTGHSQR